MTGEMVIGNPDPRIFSYTITEIVQEVVKRPGCYCKLSPQTVHMKAGNF